MSGGALLAGGPLYPDSALSPLAWITVAPWHAHEVAYCYREYSRERRGLPPDGPAEG